MKRGVLVILAACVLAACAAETIERRRPRRGPVKEVGYVDYGGGHVRYSAEGWSWAVASRRRLALKLMSRNCGKDLEPKVTDEYVRQDADAPYAGQDIDSSMSIGDEHYKIERFVHLSYECRVPGAPEPVISTAAARAPLLVVPGIEISTGVVVSTEAAPVPAPVPSTNTLPSPENPQ